MRLPRTPMVTGRATAFSRNRMRGCQKAPKRASILPIQYVWGGQAHGRPHCDSEYLERSPQWYGLVGAKPIPRTSCARRPSPQGRAPLLYHIDRRLVAARRPHCRSAHHFPAARRITGPQNGRAAKWNGAAIQEQSPQREPFSVQWRVLAPQKGDGGHHPA